MRPQTEAQNMDQMIATRFISSKTPWGRGSFIYIKAVIKTFQIVVCEIFLRRFFFSTCIFTNFQETFPVLESPVSDPGAMRFLRCGAVPPAICENCSDNRC